jgi:hypothetical protein
MDAIELLEHDHKVTREAVEKILKSSGTSRQHLFATLKRNLELHDQLEETIFYPSIQSGPPTAGFTVQGTEAHRLVESALNHLAKLPVEDPTWTPIFSAMVNKLFQHLQDEETRVFTKIRELLSVRELNEIGSRIISQKEQQLRYV